MENPGGDWGLGGGSKDPGGMLGVWEGTRDLKKELRVLREVGSSGGGWGKKGVGGLKGGLGFQRGVGGL